MKKIITLCCLALSLQATQTVNAQVVLNEIYTDPGSGNHEFFELYNTSVSNNAISMDDYTVVTYFENGPTEKGFYVLDLPNMKVGPKGYFVGAASTPFNYQGNLNSNAAHFSWNDPALLSKSGYLKKMVLTGPNNTPDNSKVFVEQPAPANLNDLFSKRTGNGATYSTFVYKNGKMVNAFFGGTGGIKTVPQFITEMPELDVTIKTEKTEKNFTINFNSYSKLTAEIVIEDAGSDNGFIRTKDGLCNYWGKSSANAFHTPGKTNGGAAGILGSLTIDSHISLGAAPTDSSFINYNITSGPHNLFAVNLQVYLDNGAIEGQLDSLDLFVGQNTEDTVTDGGFKTYYMPQRQDLLLVAETSLGCLDQIVYLNPPATSAYTTLPVKIVSFAAQKATAYTTLQWQVEENEMGKAFEVQKSYDGENFTNAGTVAATNKTGNEMYSYQSAKEVTKTYYRLRVMHHNSTVTYSQVVSTAGQEKENNKFKVLQNPVQAALHISFTADKSEEKNVTIYNMAGIKVYTQKLTAQAGTNQSQIAMDARFTAGSYIVQVGNTQSSSSAKFIKQ